MKKIVKKAFNLIGLEVSRQVRGARVPLPGSVQRPIADIRMFLEDVRSRGFEPRGILDVGANRGHWTTMALGVFPNARVVMIEPLDEVEEQLRDLCAAHANVRFIKAAAAAQEGELIQTVALGDLAASSFLPEVNQENLRTGRQRKTKTVSIDRALLGFPEFHPDLVKLYTQGFELEALKGAESLFSKTELFVVETSLYRFEKNMPIAGETIRFMADRGYEIYDIAEYLRRPYDGALVQVDFAFAKSRGILRNSDKWIP